MDELTPNEGRLLARLLEKMEHVEQDVRDIKGALERRYVTREEFDPIKNIVYGGVAVVLIAVVGALMIVIGIARRVP